MLLPFTSVRAIRRDLLTTTALTLGLAFLCADPARAQYVAGGGTATGANATAIGPNATANGDESFAGGYNAGATGNGAVAIGSGAKSQSSTNNQGIINYRDNRGVGNPTAGSGGGVTTGSNGNTVPPNEAANAPGAMPSGTAIGKNSTVGAAGGVAVGSNNTAGTGTFNSTAIGANNVAGGSYATAIGYANIANGRSTLSLGTNNQALGDIAIALGRQSYAIGDYSFAQGFVASAYGNDALAIGRLSTAGESSGTPTVSNIAIGDRSSAKGGSALALGSSATAANARSVAVGAGAMALRGAISGNEAYSGNAFSANTSEFSVGAAGSERQITNVAGGTQDTDAVNLRQLRTVGSKLATSLGSSFDPTTGVYSAPAYSYGGATFATVPGVVNAIDTLGLRYNTDGSGNRLPSIDLTRSGTVGSAVSITGLAPATSDSGAVALSQMPLRYSTAANPTLANSAVPSNDVTLVGSSVGQAVTLHNVAPGTLSANSTDAVNGGQLYQTDQTVGGLSTGLQNGTVGIVQQDLSSRKIAVGSTTDGSEVDLTGTQGTRRLTGLSSGTANSDAATFGQLRLSGNALASGLGGGSAYDAATGTFTAPSYAVGGRTYGNVGAALAATNNLTVQYVPDANGSPTGVVDLAKGASTPIALRSVSAGRLASGSTDAVNGDQLYQTNQQVGQNTADIATTASGLSTLSQGINSGTVGLVRQDATSRALTVGASTDGALVNFTNNAGTARVLTGVAAGQVAANSLDGVNGGQLYDLGQRVDASSGASSNFQNGVIAGTIGLVQQNPASRDLTVGANTDGSRVQLRNGTNGTRLMTGLSDGVLSAGSSDAVTGSQLYDTNQRVTGNSADLANLQSGILRGSIGLLQQDQASGALTIAAATGGNSLRIANNLGQARTLAGVASGSVAANSTDAVNGGQLYQTNQTVAGLAAGLQGGTVGLVQQNATSRTLSVGASTDGTVVDFANQNGAARTLNGVAAGMVAAGSTQGVNGAQVYAVTASLANALGGGATLASNGALIAPNYLIRGTTYNTVGGALGGLDAAVATLTTSGSRYVGVNSTGPAAQAQGVDTAAIGPGAIAGADRAVALGAGAVANRGGMSGATEAFSGVSVISQQGAISVGDLGSERQITNVAGGTQATDAVNVRQLSATGSNLANALGGGAGFSANGTFTAPSYTVGGQRYASVGAALGGVDTYGVRYDVDPASGARGQSLTLAGGDPNQPVLIRNVASGVLSTDAANVRQIVQAKADANAYTDRSVATAVAAGNSYTDAAVAPLQKHMVSFGNQLTDLHRQIGDVRNEARRGAAIGLAAAALRFDDRPGKISVAAGGGAWRSEAAASFGVGYTLPDGSARVNATGVAAGRDFGIGAGASFTLN